jgi:DNA-directed RNA polymerase subunit RPC12/RpoP
MVGMGIKAKCRNCGCEAPADQFKLHYELRTMVCPNCFSGRGKKELKKDGSKEKVADPSRPAGWDAEDDYLEKMARIKRQQTQASFSKIPNSDHVKYICVNCKYSFRYDPLKKLPYTCPYCNAEIPRLRTFNLL